MQFVVTVTVSLLAFVAFIVPDNSVLGTPAKDQTVFQEQEDLKDGLLESTIIAKRSEAPVDALPDNNDAFRQRRLADNVNSSHFEGDNDNTGIQSQGSQNKITGVRPKRLADNVGSEHFGGNNNNSGIQSQGDHNVVGGRRQKRLADTVNSQNFSGNNKNTGVQSQGHQNVVNGVRPKRLADNVGSTIFSGNNKNSGVQSQGDRNVVNGPLLPLEKYYIITSLNSQYVLDGTDQQLKIQTNTAVPTQLWKLIPSSDGSYYIRNKGNGLFLDIQLDADIGGGNQVIISPKSPSLSQRWFVNADYNIVSAYNRNYVLDVFQDQYFPGNKVIVFPKSGNLNQKFKLETQ